MPSTAAYAGFLAGAGLIVAIGAQNAFVLRQGLQRAHVALVVATCSIGDLVCIACGVAGIGALVHAWPGLLQGLRFGGAAFLVGYALLAARRAWRGAGALVPTAAGTTSWRKVLAASLGFTFLNPYVYLDTMVLLGSLSTHYPGSGHWTFGIGATCASVLWFVVLGYGARFLAPAFRNPFAWRVLDGVVAVFMLGVGLTLLLHPLP